MHLPAAGIVSALPIVLASGSPRRRELMASLGFEFSVEVSDFDEGLISLDLGAEDYVTALAMAKACRVAERLGLPSVVVAADTTVVLAGQKLNKPADAEEARHMLRTLSGVRHSVYSGLAIVGGSLGSFVRSVRTDVFFRELGEAEVGAYVASGGPMDKAGAYGIQDPWGQTFVDRIEGCYTNVVGLPVPTLMVGLRTVLGESA